MGWRNHPSNQGIEAILPQFAGERQPSVVVARGCDNGRSRVVLEDPARGQAQHKDGFFLKLVAVGFQLWNGGSVRGSVHSLEPEPARPKHNNSAASEATGRVEWRALNATTTICLEPASSLT